MKRILYGFLCEFSRASFWPFRERQWTREELLVITSALAFLLLLTLLLLFLSRRWKKAIRAVNHERITTRPSVGDTGLSGVGKRDRDGADSEEVLADIEDGEIPIDGNPARRQAKSGVRGDSEGYPGRLATTEVEQRNKSGGRGARTRKDKIGHTIQVAAKGPRQMLAELAEDIRDLNVQNGMSNRPDAKLDAALKALEAGRAGGYKAAIEALGELIDIVERERRDDDMVLQDDAEDLIDAAREIIKLLA